MTTTPDPLPEETRTAATDGAPGQRHGDPLLASARDRNDGDDGSRHGADAAGQDATAG